MGIELGDMWVRYRADVSDLASKMSQAKSSMSSANDSAQSAGSGIFSAFQNAGSSLVNFGSQVIQGMNTLQNLGQGAVSLAENLLAPAASAETMGTAFTTLLGSTKAANDEMQKLDAFASKTPFTTMDIDQAASQLVGFGASATDVVPDLTAIGDALSAVGRGSAANLDSVVNVFGKIQTEGKLSVGTMQELSVNGVNAWSVLEKQTGKTKDQLTNMIQAGLFPAKDAIADLTKGIEANPLYTGGMAKQSNTMQGLVSTLKSNWDQLLTSFGSPILKGLEPIIGGIGTALTSSGFKSFAGSVGQGIVNAFTDIGNGAHYVQEVLATVNTSDFGQAMKDIGVEARQVGEWLKQLGAAIHPVAVDFDPLADVIQKLAQGGLNVLSGLLRDVSGAFNLVNKTVQGGTTPLSGIGAIFKQLAGPIGNIATLMGGEFNRSLKDIGDVAQQVGGWFMTSVVPALQDAAPGFEALGSVILSDVVPAIFQIRGMVMDLVEHAFKVFGPIIEKMVPPLIRFAGVLSKDVADGLKFVMPYVLDAARAVSKFADEIMDRVAPIINKWIHDMTPLVQTFMVFWKAAWPTISAVLKGVWDEIVGVVKIAWALVSGIIKIGLDLLSGNWSQAWTDFKDMLSGIWDGIKTYLSGAWEIITAYFSVAWKAIQQIFGPVGKWFQDRWSEVTRIFSNIGGWFHDRFTDAMSGISGVFGNIGGWFTDRWHDIQKNTKKEWDGITGIFMDIGKKITDIWNTSVGNIVHAFSWLYDHNYYFKDLVDGIKKVFTDVSNWLQTTWTTVSTWLSNAWKNTVTVARDVWQKVSSVIHDGFFTAIAFVVAIWGFISGVFSNAWTNYIQKPLTSAWQSVSSFFSNAWKNWIVGPLTSFWQSVSGFFSAAWATYVQKPVGDFWGKFSDNVGKAWSTLTGDFNNLWKSISDWFAGLAQDAIQWGVNIIDNIGAGIQSGIGAIGSTISNIGSNAWHAVGGHAAGGNNLPAGWSIIGEKGPELQYTPAGSSILPNDVFQGLMSGRSAAPSVQSSGGGGSSGGGNITHVHVHNEIYLDERKMTDIIMTRAAKMIRMQGGVILNI